MPPEIQLTEDAVCSIIIPVPSVQHGLTRGPGVSLWLISKAFSLVQFDCVGVLKSNYRGYQSMGGRQCVTGNVNFDYSVTDVR